MNRVALVAPALALRLGLRLLLSGGDSVEVVAEAAPWRSYFPLRARSRLATEVDVLCWWRILRLTPCRRAPPCPSCCCQRRPAGLPELARSSPVPGDCCSLESSAEELSAALSALHEGCLSARPALLSRRAYRPRRWKSGPCRVNWTNPPAAMLTERESEVLGLLAQGLANKQIAARLGISEHTVKFHVSAIYSKLGASSRTEAVRLGVRLGLIVL